MQRRHGNKVHSNIAGHVASKGEYIDVDRERGDGFARLGGYESERAVAPLCARHPRNKSAPGWLVAVWHNNKARQTLMETFGSSSPFSIHLYGLKLAY